MMADLPEALRRHTDAADTAKAAAAGELPEYFVKTSIFNRAVI